MPTTLFRIPALATLIIVGGWLGQQLAVPPGYASPIWPPAGLALAALLLWGKNLWPAIWLGSFGLNLWIGSGATGSLNAAAIYAAMGIAGGSTLQALAGIWLSEKWIQPGIPRLDAPRSTFTFLGLAGPLACLIAPTVGVGTLLMLGIMPQTAAFFSWWNWWVGDSLGVMIVVPMIFCLFARPHEFWNPRRLTVALPLIATLLALIIVFVFVFRAEQARVQLQLDSRAVTIEKALAEHLDNVIDGTLSIRDFYSASVNVERSEFSLFTQRMLKLHPELQALSWIPLVPGEKLKQTEKSAQSEGLENFRIMERAADDTLVPAQPRAEYFPVLFIEPIAGNEKALGFDLASESIRRQALEAARSSGNVSVTQRIHLVQEAENRHSVLIVVPVYANTLMTGNSGFKGFITGVVRITPLVDIALKGLDSKHLHIVIRDLSVPADEAILYADATQQHRLKGYHLRDWQKTLPFGNRSIQITIKPDESFVAEYGSWLPWITLIGGLGFTGLLSIYLLTITGRTSHIQALVDKRTKELRESESKLRTIVDSEPECVKLLAPNGTLLQMNPAGLKMIEADSLEQVVGRQMSDLLLPQHREAFRALTQRVFDGESGTLEFEIRGLKGGHCWLDTHAVPMRDAQGNITALLGLARNITVRKLAEEKLELLARIFAEAHEGILITNTNGIIIDVNPTFCEITGYSREEMIGQNPRILSSGRQDPEFYAAMWKMLAEQGHWQGEIWNRKKDGDLFAELLTISALKNEQGESINYVGLFSDITQSKHQQQTLELMAHYDALTKLPNRVLYADRFNQAIARSRREESLLAVCYLDLDGFKQVNDTLGHDAGDQLLIEVAGRIKGCLREEDTVSRLGGDEFALLMGDIKTLDQCEQALTRIHHTIAQPYLIDDQPVTIAASSGVTLYPLDDADPDTLLRHADQAMYRAKAEGRNRYHLFDAMQDQQLQSQRQQLGVIEEAFSRNEFCLYYQPKVDMSNGQVIGAEALIRWQHPERGIVPPIEFLPVIEDTPFEIVLGNWVIDQGLRQIDLWNQQGLAIQVSVNISPAHLQWPHFAAQLETALTFYPHIPSHQLQLEMLESSVMGDLSAIGDVIKTCRDTLGVSIALDDFGTGYSSLTHLRRLPANTIKIDQSFVRDMIDDPNDYAIVEGVVGLAHAFRRDVIAEGVETRDHGLMLLTMGCHHAQGYGIARPMPADAIVKWVKNYKPDAKWQDYARHPLTQSQADVLLMTIESNQWVKRMEECLSASQDASLHWPIMDYDHCHCGRWILYAEKSGLFDPALLTTLNQAHEELHRIGNVLMYKRRDGKIEEAREGIPLLKATHQAIEGLLSQLV